jgi:ATP-dependent DNA ligase
VTRKRTASYTGATGRVTLDDAARLPPRYWFQEKKDGAYVTVRIDSTGRIASILTRSGKRLPSRLGAGLLGLRTCTRDSLLHGEIDGYTQAGMRRAEAQGHSNVHLFDCTRYNGRDIGGRSYRYRYGALQSHATQWEQTTDGRPWSVDGAGDAHDSRGRYAKRTPSAWRRFPIVPLRHPRDLSELWTSVVDDGKREGLVAVDTTAPVRRRRAKLKIKHTDTLDAVVVRIEGKRTAVAWPPQPDGHFVVCARTPLLYDVGDWVEITCNGFYEDGLPRYPRITRTRLEM